MAITEKTIGGTTPDYATITLWESNRQTASSATDTERGLCRAVTFDEHPNIAGWTNGVIIELVADSGAEHGGIEGTGPTIDPTTGGHCLELTEADCDILVRGIEFTGVTVDSDEGIRVNGGVTVTVDTCLFYDITVTTDCDGIYSASSTASTITVLNSSFRNIDRGCIHHQNGTATTTLRNCTLWNSGGATALQQRSDSASHDNTIIAYNCLLSADSNAVFHFGTPVGTLLLELEDCLLNDASGTTYATTMTNVTESVTFQEGTGGSGDRAMFLDLTVTGGYDLHLEDHVDNLAIDYGDGANAPSTGVDWEGDTRATTGTSNVAAGADEIVSGSTGDADASTIAIQLTQNTAAGTGAADVTASTIAIEATQNVSVGSGAATAATNTVAIELTQNTAAGSGAATAATNTIAIELTQNTAAGSGAATAATNTTAIELTQNTAVADGGGTTGNAFANTIAIELTQNAAVGTGAGTITASTVSIELTQNTAVADGGSGTTGDAAAKTIAIQLLQFPATAVGSLDSQRPGFPQAPVVTSSKSILRDPVLRSSGIVTAKKLIKTGNVSLTWDDATGLVSTLTHGDGEVWEFLWDAEGRLSTVTNGSITKTLTWSGFRLSGISVTEE